jgi:hypothetical protein
MPLLIVYVNSRSSDEPAEVVQSPAGTLEKTIASARARVDLLAGFPEGKGFAGFLVENSGGQILHRYYRQVGRGRDPWGDAGAASVYEHATSED